MCHNGDVKRLANGDVCITIKIVNIASTVAGVTATEMMDNLLYACWVDGTGDESKAQLVSGDTWSSGEFVIKIPLATYESWVITTAHTVYFRIGFCITHPGVMSLNIEQLSITITPSVAIAVSDSVIDLGVLTLNGYNLVSVGEHYLTVNFAIMVDAICNM